MIFIYIYIIYTYRYASVHVHASSFSMQFIGMWRNCAKDALPLLGEAPHASAQLYARSGTGTYPEGLLKLDDWRVDGIVWKDVAILMGNKSILSSIKFYTSLFYGRFI